MGEIIPINRPRVDLHRNLVARAEINNRLQSSAKLAELLLVKVGGRPAAEVNFTYLQKVTGLCAELLEVVNLLQKMVEKELNFSPVVRDQYRADAIAAQFLTEGNMDIQMERFTSLEKPPE